MIPDFERQVLDQLKELTTLLRAPDTGFIALTNATLEDHEKRIRNLEIWMWRSLGAMALVGFVADIVFRH